MSILSVSETIGSAPNVNFFFCSSQDLFPLQINASRLRYTYTGTISVVSNWEMEFIKSLFFIKMLNGLSFPLHIKALVVSKRWCPDRASHIL